MCYKDMEFFYKLFQYKAMLAVNNMMGKNKGNTMPLYYPCNGHVWLITGFIFCYVLLEIVKFYY